MTEAGDERKSVKKAYEAPMQTLAKATSLVAHGDFSVYVPTINTPDKFYQGDASHSTQGNGLGLAQVKRILQLSDGSITVESAAGKGSVFNVTLPLIPADRRMEMEEIYQICEKGHALL